MCVLYVEDEEFDKVPDMCGVLFGFNMPANVSKTFDPLTPAESRSCWIKLWCDAKRLAT